mgnify:CR=1 FL=1
MPCNKILFKNKLFLSNIFNHKSMRAFVLIIFSFIFFNSCETDDEIQIDISFRQFVGQNQLELNNMTYENEAGNLYSVERFLYVISDLTLYFENGESMSLDDYYFIDLDNQNSLKIKNIDIPSLCVSVSFTYGFSQNNNVTDVYLNDANNFHNLMLWPTTLGGGYHYMKLEGKYLDNYGEQKFYNTHTGGLYGNDYSMNYFFDFDASENQTEIYIDMNINNIYNDPIYDFNYYGSAIMSSEEAQSVIQINMMEGVFSVSEN